MTNKETILALIRRLPDNVTIEEVIDCLYLLHKVEIGLAQAERGEVMEHDQFFDELLADR
jgi:hypothetical protein